MASDADSYKMDFVEVRVPDLMNLVEVIGLALGKQQAEDIAKCHNNLVDVRYSPLTKELEAVRDRFEGHVKDYWAERGRAQAQEELAAADDTEVADEPELHATPLGALTGDHRAPALEFTDDDEPEDEEDE